MALTGVGIGGGIANLGTLTVSDSTFSGNQARGASESSNIGPNSFPGFGIGGGLANGGYPAEGGGATATVTHCQFTSNLAQGGNGCTSTYSPGGIAGAAGGGAIGNFGFGTWDSPGLANLIVSGSKFSNNRAIGGNDNQSAAFPGKAVGGAIASHSLLMFGGSTSLDISDNTFFSHNEAIGGNHNVFLEGNPDGGGADQSVGGAIFAFPTGTITHSTFDHNQAIGGQGIAGTSGDLTTVNGGDAGGGAICFNFLMNDVTVSDCTFKHNSAIGGQAGAGGTGGDGGGGAVSMGSPNNLMIIGCIIDHNQAQGGSADTIGPASHGGPAEGGGVDNLGGATVIASTITHNQAIGAAGGNGGNGGHGWGGGVANESGGTLSISSTTVAYNEAQGGNGGNGGNGWGGGLYIDASSTLILTGATVQHNFAIGGAGGAGGSDGQGIGAGVYAIGALDFIGTNVVTKNHASTSNDDIFPS
jgi:hypothetical protein